LGSRVKSPFCPKTEKVERATIGGLIGARTLFVVIAGSRVLGSTYTPYG
jgi:hypothetical protein